MHESVIARKYALALFNAARAGQRLDAVASDVEALGHLDRLDGRLVRYLESPKELTSAKEELIDRALRGRVDPVTLNFLHLVLRKKRASLLETIFAEFMKMVRRHRGILRVRVTSAVALEGPEQQRLQKGLDRLTGMSTELDCHVDPALMGGVVVMYEDRIIDRSVRRGLDDLREELMKVRVL